MLTMCMAPEAGSGYWLLVLCSGTGFDFLGGTVPTFVCTCAGSEGILCSTTSPTLRTPSLQAEYGWGAVASREGPTRCSSHLPSCFLSVAVLKRVLYLSG